MAEETIQQPSLQISTARINAIILVILGLFPLIGMGIDLIAPSLPAISQSLHVSDVVSKNLITAYLFGYVIGSFSMGFLTDMIGRRFIILFALLLFAVSSLFPTILPNPLVLLATRLLQGIAISAFAVVGRAVFSDIIVSKERLIKIAAMTATMWGIGPIIGPFIGGYLQYYFNWQANFYFFACYGLAGFSFMLLVLPETHFNRQKLNMGQITNNFKTIIKSPLFIGLVTCMGLTYSLLIAFNSLGPFLIQNVLGYSSIHFGHIALYLGVVFLSGTIVCRYLINRHTPQKIISYTVFISLFVALLGLVFTLIANKNLTLIIALSLYMFFISGILYPTALGGAISMFRQFAGTSSAVMNLINLLTTSITAFFMSFIYLHSAMPIVLTYFILITLCCLTYWALMRKSS